MNIAKNILSAAEKRGYLKPNDVEVIYKRLVQMGKTLNQTNAENFADQICLAMILESNLDPSIANSYGCCGLIQFCPGTGLSVINQSIDAVISMSFLRQLDEVEKYMKYTMTFAEYTDPSNITAVEQYLTILLPADVGNGIDEPVDAGGHQAEILYNNEGHITKRSIAKALEQLYKEYTGQTTSLDITSSNGSRGSKGDSSNSQPGFYSQDGIFLISAVSSKRKYFTNMRDAKVAAPEILSKVTYAGGQASVDSGGVASTDSQKPINISNVSLPDNFSQSDFTNPLPGGVLTSGFGMRWGRMHNGVDLSGGGGLKIVSAGDGVVTEVCNIDNQTRKILNIVSKTLEELGAGGDCGNYGNSLVITHSESIQTTYNHIEHEGIKVQVGQEVKKGEEIAIEGNTGSSTAPHLHFEVKVNGEYIDPMTVITV